MKKIYAALLLLASLTGCRTTQQETVCVRKGMDFRVAVSVLSRQGLKEAPGAALTQDAMWPKHIEPHLFFMKGDKTLEIDVDKRTGLITTITLIENDDLPKADRKYRQIDRFTP
jgi:hypothetical protein